MANPLPSLRGSAQQALYPVVRKVSCLTKVNIMANAVERRWVQRQPLYDFELSMQSLLDANRMDWVSFQDTVRGRKESNLQLTLGGTTYSNLTLMSDHLTVTNRMSLQYDIKVQLRQTRPPATTYTPPTVDDIYPTLSFGKVAERPFVQVLSFMTDVNDNPYGPRFTYSWYKESVSGFPTDKLRSWQLSYPLITDADLATIETFFLGKQGRYKAFVFVDPIDSTAYSNVRFASDELVVRHLTANQNSVDVILRQVPLAASASLFDEASGLFDDAPGNFDSLG